ncbi:Anthracycline biosynthesis protein DnrV [Frankia canadensis]|uniref:Anthracycline biosynthesis protein DnrV n=1 Tax=Frankia canadensis TaxID=1836972 RepID=A0A2I2KV62_9ACTN|nr:VOC family protein [Frankia canadensis]SNQ49542.1 Anthracycline biosynthesis protein DnrV [Frankia canadensis]SOU56832.1 Anthracycline biosynthesis protein DnrV [Frankia canadensis]
MAEFTSYEPGTPCWVDLGSPDLDASRAFYGTLFGWEAQVSPDPAAGGYTILTLRGRAVAGLGPLFGEGQRPSWSTYVRVADADATAEAVRAAGGSVLAPPMDVFDMGRMAVFGDSGGAAVSVWQPGTFAGAELANEPGSFSWNELDTRDLAAARAFYPAVFGWTLDEAAQAGPMEYYTWQVAGRPVAGMMPMPPTVPADTPSLWLAYFAVADTDAALARITELGGATLTGPVDIPAGRFAVVAGPHGEAFAIIAQ